MQHTARRSSSSLVGVLGLILIGAWIVAAFGVMGSRSFEELSPWLVAPILLLVSLPALSRQAERENDRTLFWLLVAALSLKLIAALVRHYVAFTVYGGATDAKSYSEYGVHIAAQFRGGNFHTSLSSLTGTNFIRFFTGVIYTGIGSNIISGFLFYSWLGFWGLFLCYRAFTLAVPEGRRRTYARLLFFLPSFLYWPSAIGKDAWMLFAIGIFAYGVAKIFATSVWRGAPLTALGLVLMAQVRPPVAGMLALGLGVGAVLRRPKEKLGQLSPVAKVLMLAAMVVVGIVFVSKTNTFLVSSGIDPYSGSSNLSAQLGERTGQGGSLFTPYSILHSPANLPGGIVTVLYRPLPFEAHSTEAMLSALEGAFLLLLTVVRWRWMVTALGSMRRQPYVAFCFASAGLLIIALSSFANFGILARERVQALPFFLVLLAIPPPHKRTENETEKQDVDRVVFS